MIKRNNACCNKARGYNNSSGGWLNNRCNKYTQKKSFDKRFFPLINEKSINLIWQKNFKKCEPIKCFLVRIIYYIQEIFKLEEFYKKKNDNITPEIRKKSERMW